MSRVVKGRIRNRVAEFRKKRVLAASDLARRVGVSRQTIYAIEAGTYVPNTEVALRIARELEVTVNDLFSLKDGTQDQQDPVTADVLSATPAETGQQVRIGRVESRWVSVPGNASPYYMPEADGIIKRPERASGRTELVVLANEEETRNRLVLAGCDPAAGLLCRIVEKASGIEIVTAAASSKLALTWLKEGKVHIAGSHLEDPKTGEFNLPFLRKEFAAEELSVVTLARWEEGLVVAHGNPMGIRRVEDLGRKKIRFVNRETGSGSRALLERLLDKAGMEPNRVRGFYQIAYGHLAAAHSVISGTADVCLATRSAAISFGLDFIPLHEERYDLVMRRRSMEIPAVQAFVDVLQRATLRRKLELLARYDVSETGAVAALSL